MHEHDSHKSKPSHHSAYSNETYNDGYKAGYEDSLSDYEIDVDESTEFG